MPDQNHAKPSLEGESQPQSFFEFPCQFPIKIMANPQKEVVEFILDTLEQWVDDPEAIDFKTRESKNWKIYFDYGDIWSQKQGSAW